MGRIETTEIIDPVDSYAIEAAEAHYPAARAAALMSLNGNPYGADLRTEGPLQGLLVRAMPSPMSNRICGNPEEALGSFATLLDWFSEHNCDPAIPRVIGNCQPTRHSGSASMNCSASGDGRMCSLPGRLAKRRNRIQSSRIEEVTAKTVDEFAAIHAEGFRTPVVRRAINRASFAGLLSGGRAKGFLAQIDGKPVAGAIIYFAQTGVAYLATAAPRCIARGGGCHAALIEYRIAAAQEYGSKFVAATALPNSTSRRILSALAWPPPTCRCFAICRVTADFQTLQKSG